jgi:hypothetical protein
MLFPSSGRAAFGYIRPSESAELPDLTTLKAMIRREAELRLSEEAQQVMDELRHDEDEVTRFTEALQLEVVREFGYNDLNILQSAQSRFPDDPDIRNTFYVKFNRCSDSGLAVGQALPDVPLSWLDGKEMKLAEFYSKDEGFAAPRPLVIVAGSIS